MTLKSIELHYELMSGSPQDILIFIHLILKTKIWVERESNQQHNLFKTSIGHLHSNQGYGKVKVSPS